MSTNNSFPSPTDVPQTLTQYRQTLLKLRIQAITKKNHHNSSNLTLSINQLNQSIAELLETHFQDDSLHQGDFHIDQIPHDETPSNQTRALKQWFEESVSVIARLRRIWREISSHGAPKRKSINSTAASHGPVKAPSSPQNLPQSHPSSHVHQHTHSSTQNSINYSYSQHGSSSTLQQQVSLVGSSHSKHASDSFSSSHASNSSMSHSNPMSQHSHQSDSIRHSLLEVGEKIVSSPRLDKVVDSLTRMQLNMSHDEEQSHKQHRDTQRNSHLPSRKHEPLLSSSAKHQENASSAERNSPLQDIEETEEDDLIRAEQLAQMRSAVINQTVALLRLEFDRDVLLEQKLREVPQEQQQYQKFLSQKASQYNSELVRIRNAMNQVSSEIHTLQQQQQGNSNGNQPLNADLQNSLPEKSPQQKERNERKDMHNMYSNLSDTLKRQPTEIEASQRKQDDDRGNADNDESSSVESEEEPPVASSIDDEQDEHESNYSSDSGSYHSEEHIYMTKDGSGFLQNISSGSTKQNSPLSKSPNQEIHTSVTQETSQEDAAESNSDSHSGVHSSQQSKTPVSSEPNDSTNLDNMTQEERLEYFRRQEFDLLLKRMNSDGIQAPVPVLSPSVVKLQDSNFNEYQNSPNNAASSPSGGLSPNSRVMELDAMWKQQKELSSGLSRNHSSPFPQDRYRSGNFDRNRSRTISTSSPQVPTPSTTQTEQVSPSQRRFATSEGSHSASFPESDADADSSYNEVENIYDFQAEFQNGDPTIHSLPVGNNAPHPNDAPPSDMYNNAEPRGNSVHPPSHMAQLPPSSQAYFQYENGMHYYEAEQDHLAADDAAHQNAHHHQQPVYHQQDDSLPPHQINEHDNALPSPVHPSTHQSVHRVYDDFDDDDDEFFDEAQESQDSSPIAASPQQQQHNANTLYGVSAPRSSKKTVKRTPKKRVSRADSPKQKKRPSTSASVPKSSTQSEKRKSLRSRSTSAGRKVSGKTRAQRSRNSFSPQPRSNRQSISATSSNTSGNTTSNTSGKQNKITPEEGRRLARMRAAKLLREKKKKEEMKKLEAMTKKEKVLEVQERARKRAELAARLADEKKAMLDIIEDLSDDEEDQQVDQEIEEDQEKIAANDERIREAQRKARQRARLAKKKLQDVRMQKEIEKAKRDKEKWQRRDKHLKEWAAERKKREEMKQKWEQQQQRMKVKQQQVGSKDDNGDEESPERAPESDQEQQHITDTSQKHEQEEVQPKSSVHDTPVKQSSQRLLPASHPVPQPPPRQEKPNANNQAKKTTRRKTPTRSKPWKKPSPSNKKTVSSKEKPVEIFYKPKGSTTSQSAGKKKTVKSTKRNEQANGASSQTSKSSQGATAKQESRIPAAPTGQARRLKSPIVTTQTPPHYKKLLEDSSTDSIPFSPFPQEDAPAGSGENVKESPQRVTHEFRKQPANAQKQSFLSSLDSPLNDPSINFYENTYYKEQDEALDSSEEDEQQYVDGVHDLSGVSSNDSQFLLSDIPPQPKKAIPKPTTKTLRNGNGVVASSTTGGGQSSNKARNRFGWKG